MRGLTRFAVAVPVALAVGGGGVFGWHALADAAQPVATPTAVPVVVAPAAPAPAPIPVVAPTTAPRATVSTPTRRVVKTAATAKTTAKVPAKNAPTVRKRKLPAESPCPAALGPQCDSVWHEQWAQGQADYAASHGWK
jgi:hypothetical protein